MEHLGTLFEMGKAICAPLQSLKENEDILDKKIEELSCRESDVRADLERGKLQYGKMPKREVELWLKNVQNIKDKVHDIKQKLEEVSWTHIQLRMNLAKEVEEKIKEAVELKENGRFQEGLLVDLLEGSIETFPPIKIVGETTALKNLQKIEECLMDDEVGKIGVYGMGGVGKTTIMTNIHNNIKKAGTFDRVIWVTVSKESNVKKLQDDVAKELCLSLSNTEDALRRSAEIFRALNLIGKFLLILDDMWRLFSLTEIGIPEPNEENKCKIVWTTRSKKVCRGMGSQRTIKVDALAKDESWTLFKEKLDADFVLSPEIEPIAKAVVEECDGLPLGIITVGAAMRGVDDTRIWRSALEDLRNSRPDLEGLEDVVFSSLRFSFDHLKTQIHRDCFLYCSLYPEDDRIACDSLIENWMADGFFDDIEDREKGFDKGYTIINDLKDTCMLENCNRDGLDISFVKMHDLLRDLAIAITRKSHQFVVKVCSNVGKFPRDENLMDDVIRVSLMYSNIELLSCRSKYPKLSTLLLEGSRLRNIDHLFFEHMQNLRVLDLSNINFITHLPQSPSNWVRESPQNPGFVPGLWHGPRGRWIPEPSWIQRPPWGPCQSPGTKPLLCSTVDLVNLHVPRLVGLNHLREVPSPCFITYLPQSLSNLVNLRVLRLVGLNHLKEVPSLVQLRELRVLDFSGTSIKYFPDGMDRLTNLRCLGLSNTTSLEMVPVGAISRFSHLEELLMVGSKWKWSSNENRNGRGAGVADIVRLMHLKKLLVDFVDLSALSSYVRSGHWRGLNCYVLTVGYRFNDLEGIKYNFYSRVREVNVFHSDCMSTIYMEEPTQGDNLANLKYIHIRNCPKLKYVFSVGWFQNLQNLEEISVEYCQAMEETVVDMGDMGEANNNITITLPRLKRLALLFLPKLKSICKRTLICTSLELIRVDKCPNLKTLPFSINSLPSSLKQIKGSRRWWDSLEWDNANTKMHLQPLFSDGPQYGFQLEEDQERQHLQFSERPDYGFQREEDQERPGTKRKADSYLLDLNLPPLSLVQRHGESEPRELSPRNWQLWKTRE